MLQSMGFKSIEVDSIASPYGGLILQVQVNGHHVAPGTNVGINSHIRLTVGDGSITLKDFTASTFNVNGIKYRIKGTNFVKK